MPKRFPKAGPRDSKVLDFIAKNQFSSAADYLYDQSTAHLESEATYRRICKDYKRLCEDPIEQVVEQKLHILENALRQKNSSAHRLIGEDDFFTRKTIEFAVIAASAAMAKKAKTNHLPPDSPQRELIALFFQDCIRPRVKVFTVYWCSKMNIQVDWETKGKGEQKGINGRDLIDYLIFEIWKTSLSDFHHNRSFKWVQSFVACAAGWACRAFMSEIGEWMHPARYRLARDIQAQMEKYGENWERIAEALLRKYLSIYRDCCAVHAEPTLKYLRAFDIPDLSYFSDDHRSSDYLPEDEFRDLVKKVLSRKRISNLIDQLRLNNTMCMDETTNEVPATSSPNLPPIQARLNNIDRLLKKIHFLLAPEISRRRPNQKAFEMMWMFNDKTITAHPDFNWGPANSRAVRRRAKVRIKERLEMPDMKDLTDDERVAVLWIYENAKPPYREFADRKKDDQFAPDDWEKNLESAHQKLKNILRKKP